MKICIACSAGGHLTEISQIKKSYEKYDYFYVTFKREDSIDLSKKETVYFVNDPGRSIKNLIKCIFQSLKIMFKERPRIIISTGAGVAVPICFLAKFFSKSKIIFIESFCRIYNPSLTGRLIYPISDWFFVQWEELLKKYGDKAVYKGRVFQ
jgi:UDP-N-acetylglucosamine:LPS N-acetylglucosamine transferase